MIHDKQISNWLFFTAFMVFCMAVIGAVTRLTESGLSMVEWRPLIGTLPPLSEAEWMRVFELYRETPEYKAKNAGMTLDEFKNIFFWEWFHRLWGRLIGVVYALPLFYFWVKKQIPQRYGWKLLIGLLLGGSQAVMGWYMVESGLVDRPAVSHFRLAAHLSLAALIFGYLLIAITILWGAFVAGLGHRHPAQPRCHPPCRRASGRRLYSHCLDDLSAQENTLKTGHAKAFFMGDIDKTICDKDVSASRAFIVEYLINGKA